MINDQITEYWTVHAICENLNKFKIERNLGVLGIHRGLFWWHKYAPMHFESLEEAIKHAKNAWFYSCYDSNYVGDEVKIFHVKERIITITETTKTKVDF